nr:MAG TPA: hypothetical protein [Microviridae sp.]
MKVYSLSVEIVNQDNVVVSAIGLSCVATNLTAAQLMLKDQIKDLSSCSRSMFHLDYDLAAIMVSYTKN